ncbi:MAG: hypothetical protein PHQ59_00400 [Candidatus Daviesbacteria bacterium]|nr:hypothetical protein [Candidatus Daviesbacteria bacterium]
MIDSELNFQTQIMLSMTKEEISVLETYAAEQQAYLNQLGRTLSKEAKIEECPASIGQWVTYTPEKIAESSELARLVDQTLKDCLQPKPELVLRLRYGISTEGERLKEICEKAGISFEEIALLAICGKCSLIQLGNIFGTTLENVRQMEERAERRLKTSILKSPHFDGYIPRP